jgi:hypothetical protein
MSEKKMSWADIADEEDEKARLAAEVRPPRERQDKQKLKSLFSKEKPRK